MLAQQPPQRRRQLGATLTLQKAVGLQQLQQIEYQRLIFQELTLQLGNGQHDQRIGARPRLGGGGTHVDQHRPQGVEKGGVSARLPGVGHPLEQLHQGVQWPRELVAFAGTGKRDGM
ncbi:hypothetical protein Y695_04729 [Hydrogenophaga sp. T4]|nr:hypothetical protein Y695_04729 [Hydrogenophaga sp. T4]